MRYKAFKTILTALTLSISGHAKADLRFSGFGNIGVLASDSKELAYRNNVSQAFGKFDNELNFRTNTKLGLQVEWQGNEKFDAVTQVLLQETAYSDPAQSVRLAFLRYTPTASASIRVGRVSLDTFLLTEYREVDYAFPWAKTPNEVYGTIPYYYVDGFDASYTLPFKDFNLLTKFYYGKSSAYFSDQNSSSEIKIDELMGLSMELQSINWLLSAKMSTGLFERETGASSFLMEGFNSLTPIWSGASDFGNQFSVIDRAANYFSFGGRYDWSKVTLHAELTSFSSDSLAITGLNSGYLSLAYRLNSWQVFTKFAFNHAETYQFTAYEDHNIDISAQSPQVQALMMQLKYTAEGTANYLASNQNTLSIGSRYEYNNNIALKLQLDISHVDEGGATLWLKAPNNGPIGAETVNTLFLNVSYIF